MEEDLDFHASYTSLVFSQFMEYATVFPTSESLRICAFCMKNFLLLTCRMVCSFSSFRPRLQRESFTDHPHAANFLFSISDPAFFSLHVSRSAISLLLPVFLLHECQFRESGWRQCLSQESARRTAPWSPSQACARLRPECSHSQHAAFASLFRGQPQAAGVQLELPASHHRELKTEN